MQHLQAIFSPSSQVNMQIQSLPGITEPISHIHPHGIQACQVSQECSACSHCNDSISGDLHSQDNSSCRLNYNEAYNCLNNSTSIICSMHVPPSNASLSHVQNCRINNVDVEPNVAYDIPYVYPQDTKDSNYCLNPNEAYTCPMKINKAYDFCRVPNPRHTDTIPEIINDHDVVPVYEVVL